MTFGGLFTCLIGIAGNSFGMTIAFVILAAAGIEVPLYTQPLHTVWIWMDLFSLYLHTPVLHVPLAWPNPFHSDSYPEDMCVACTVGSCPMCDSSHWYAFGYGNT